MNNPSPLEANFFAALEKGSLQERAAFLDEACASDPDLRRRVEKMLEAQAQAGSFLEQPASPVVTFDEQPIREGPGAVIGPYKLLKQIGEGGFGIVFMAEQTEPVRRKVALKVLKPGMDTKQVVARFEAERQALAIMDHPNIARIHDGGATPLGRPYFVMELVKGVPITEFCDQNHLTPRQLPRERAGRGEPGPCDRFARGNQTRTKKRPVRPRLQAVSSSARSCPGARSARRRLPLSIVSQTEERSMKSSQKNRVRLSIETLERRDAPATLTISPPGWVDPIVKEITASARPGVATTEVHSGGVVQRSLDGAQVRAVDAAAHSHARPFHLEESGTAVINPNGTITASATGRATHLGAFTLHDTSTIVGVEVTPDGVVLHVVGEADLEAANGDHLYGSFTGSVNLTTGAGTLNFEWTGGTGRFADATGATVWHVALNSDLTYTAVADGVINY